MRHALLLALLAAPGLPARAGRLPTAYFLELPVDVRSLGMAEASLASVSGAGGVPVNPAAVNGVAAHELYFTHGLWAAGVSFDYLGYALAFGPHHWGVGYERVGYGTLDGRDDAGNPTSGFAPSDTAYTLTYGLAAGPAGAAATVKHIDSRILGSARTWSLDLGARYRPARGLTLGLAGTNLLGGLRYEQSEDPLPAAIKGGVAWAPNEAWTLGLDAAGPLYATPHVAVGAEYGYRVEKLGRVMLRLGANTKTPELGGLSGLKAGLGLDFRFLELDYAFSPFGELGYTHHLALTYRLGKGSAGP